MQLYAPDPAVRTRQVVGDLAVLAWVLFWVAVGRRLHDAVDRLGEPGRDLAGVGERFTERAEGAGTSVGRAPVVGDRLQDAFVGFGSVGEGLADAGRAQAEAAGALATTLGVSVALVPVLLVVLPWLSRRLRWSRRVAVASALVEELGGVDLLALRALATRPLQQLRAAAADPARGWRDDDPATVAALADLELAELGLASTRRTVRGAR